MPLAHAAGWAMAAYHPFERLRLTMRTRREAGSPRRPRVITARLVVVSLVVGVVLAAGSVPMGVAVQQVAMPLGITWESSRSFVFEGRRIEVSGTHTPTADGRSWVQPIMSEQERMYVVRPLAGTQTVDHDPRPWRARAWLDARGVEVTVWDAGWPLRAAEWHFRSPVGGQGRSGQPMTPHMVGVWRPTRSGSHWFIPVLPLWPGLLGNTLFYALLVLTPLALLRWRKLRRRARRGLCVACGYELGEGVGACPECGLTLRAS